MFGTHLRKMTCAVILAGSVSMFSVSAEAEAEELRMLSGFPNNFIWTVEHAKKFVEKVQTATNGQISITMSGPDTVPTFEQFEPVQAGVFDLLFTHPAYHSGTTAIGLSIDAIAVDPRKRRETGVFDYIDRHYQGLGMKLIAAPSTGSKGFRYYMREPINPENSLNGLKIRGTVSYHPMIRALGGSPVNMPGGEVYSALQKGVVDGAAWALTGAKDFKWYEVAGYLAEPKFGQVGTMIFMNLDSWEALSDEAKNAISKAASELEVETLGTMDELAAAELTALQDLGMKMTEFSKEDSERFEELWANGVWEVAEEKSGAAAAELRALAKSHGMTN